MHKPTHHPQISKRADRWWVLNCPECQGAVDAAVPIGIGLPLESRYEAEMLRENHLRRRIRNIS